MADYNCPAHAVYTPTCERCRVLVLTAELAGADEELKRHGAALARATATLDRVRTIVDEACGPQTGTDEERLTELERVLSELRRERDEARAERDHFKDLLAAPARAESERLTRERDEALAWRKHIEPILELARSGDAPIDRLVRAESVLAEVVEQRDAARAESERRGEALVKASAELRHAYRARPIDPGLVARAIEILERAALSPAGEGGCVCSGAECDHSHGGACACGCSTPYQSPPAPAAEACGEPRPGCCDVAKDTPELNWTGDFWELRRVGDPDGWWCDFCPWCGSRLPEDPAGTGKRGTP